MGEANILQEFGKLQDDPAQGLEYLQQAQTLYTQIGDIYSQSRASIHYEPFIEYAQSKIAEIDSTRLST